VASSEGPAAEGEDLIADDLSRTRPAPFSSGTGVTGGPAGEGSGGGRGATSSGPSVTRSNSKCATRKL
jgi:hypothetical protein